MNQKTRVVTQLHEKLRRPGGSGACQESWVAAIWYWNPSWADCSRLWIISAREEMTQSRRRSAVTVCVLAQAGRQQQQQMQESDSQWNQWSDWAPGRRPPRVRPQHLHHRRVSMSLRLQTGETDRQRENTGNSLLLNLCFSAACRSKGTKVTLLYFPTGAMWRKRWRSGRSDSDLFYCASWSWTLTSGKGTSEVPSHSKLKTTTKKLLVCDSDVRFSVVVILPLMLYIHVWEKMRKEYNMLDRNSIMKFSMLQLILYISYIVIILRIYNNKYTR